MVVLAYLRFRVFEGDRVEHLLPVIESPTRWRLAPLPQATNCTSSTGALTFMFNSVDHFAEIWL
jgi:hypothetical protein